MDVNILNPASASSASIASGSTTTTTTKTGTTASSRDTESEMEIDATDAKSEESSSSATIETTNDTINTSTPGTNQDALTNSTGIKKATQRQIISLPLAMNGGGGCNPKTPNNCGNTTTTRLRKASGDVDLKSRIIEFMRDRPFLWNNKHPLYKDNRRRENEFHLFSQSINHPANDIKRIWHVLRTNFFRAHKLMLEKPQNLTRLDPGKSPEEHGSGGGGVGGSGGGPEKLWKYYLAMEFILEGTPYSKTNSVSGDTNTSTSSSGRNSTSSNNNNDTLAFTTSSSNSSLNDSLAISIGDTTRQTRSSKMLKDARGARRDVTSTPMLSQLVISAPSTTLAGAAGTMNSIVQSSNGGGNGGGSGGGGGSGSITILQPLAAPTTTMPVCKASLGVSTPNTRSGMCGRNLKSHRTNNNNNNNNNNVSTSKILATPTTITTTISTTDSSSNHSLNRLARHQRASNSSSCGYNELSLVSSSPYDSDEDHLYARSLSSTLKKFDPTTKEVIKLKFQEIIVEFMRKQQQTPQSQQQQLKLEVTPAGPQQTLEQPP